MMPDMNWVVPNESVRIGDTIYISSDKLTEWGNSLNYLGSRSLSRLLGIDDLGDLRDEVPAFRNWMDRFWTLITPEENY